MAKLKVEMPRGKRQCGEWGGQQCKATTKLTACVLSIKQGTILKGPERVVVDLCPKHFQLLIKRPAR